MGGIFEFLFHVPEAFNRTWMHNYNFTLTQSLRLANMLGSATILGILIYVWVKDCIAQLQFYTLMFWLLAISTLACSAGREVVEVKLVHKMKQEKLADGSIEPEQIDEVALPTEDKSGVWKLAVLSYAVAAPLVLASPIMFLFFPDDMFRGEVCKFYELADSGNND